MSQIRRASVTCPECGRTQAFTVYDSVNSEDRDLVNRLLTGRLFLFQCAHCGNAASVRYPLLYSDMDHCRFIWLIPPEQMREMQPQLQETALPGIRQLVVNSPEELAEAIRTVDLAQPFN